MDTLPNSEITGSREAIKRQEATPKEPLSKLQKARERFTSFSNGIRGAFSRLRQGSPPTALDTDQQELNRLSKELSDLNEETQRSLELPQGLGRTIQKLQELEKKALDQKTKDMFPVVGMLGDGDKIEGNQIDFVRQPDKTVVYFNTTPPATDSIKNEIMPNLPPSEVTDGVYEFEVKDKEGRITGSDAWVIKIDENTTVYVGKGIASIDGYTSEMYAFKGPIKIEIKDIKDPKLIAQAVESAFQKLQIPDALTPPEEQSHLKRQEVLPGYFAVTDEGASQRYLKGGEFFLVHSVAFAGSMSSADNIIPVLQHGLLSEHERLKRGKPKFDPNDPNDKTMGNLASGRAENVFLRAITAANSDKISGKINILIDPQVLDRTDWHAFLHNPAWIGPEPFKYSSPPEDFFTDIRATSYIDNEIAMSRGIPPEMIKGVVVRTKEDKKYLVEILKKSGMNKVHGLPVEEFVRLRSAAA